MADVGSVSEELFLDYHLNTLEKLKNSLKSAHWKALVHFIQFKEEASQNGINIVDRHPDLKPLLDLNLDFE